MEGIYKRHSRELTESALATMFRSSGFSITVSRTTNSFPLNPFGIPHDVIDKLVDICGNEDRGDTLNIVGSKSGGILDRYPLSNELYIQSDIDAFVTPFLK